jgi:hypothetical protein
MMKRKRDAVFSLITLLIIVGIVSISSIISTPGSSLAWWSWPPEANTHRSLSEGAIAIIPSDGYPDVTTSFGNDIADWTSNVKDDQRAHGDQSDRNDGPVAYWWKLALSQYGVFEFSGSGDPLDTPRPGAYYYLALIVHLTEDMGVPAHAYNILHSQSSEDLDNMEQVAFSSYKEANPVIIIQDMGKDLLQCYYLSRERTLSLTSTPHWRLYYNNDGTCGMHYSIPAGHYWDYCGAPDIFPEKWDDTSPDERQVISALLGSAGGYAGGVLLAASRSFPPLVKDLAIGLGSESTPVIDPQKGIRIRFIILENRSQEVYVTIKAVSSDGTEYIVTAQQDESDQGQTDLVQAFQWQSDLGQYDLVQSFQNQFDQWQYDLGQCVQNKSGQGQLEENSTNSTDSANCWDNKAVSLSRSLESRQLPWEKLITLAGWTGTSASGQLPEGLYTLKVLVRDTDGNEVNEVYPEINTDSTTRNDTERQFQIGN